MNLRAGGRTTRNQRAIDAQWALVEQKKKNMAEESASVCQHKREGEPWKCYVTEKRHTHTQTCTQGSIQIFQWPVFSLTARASFPSLSFFLASRSLHNVESFAIYISFFTLTAGSWTLCHTVGFLIDMLFYSINSHTILLMMLMFDKYTMSYWIVN